MRTDERNSLYYHQGNITVTDTPVYRATLYRPREVTQDFEIRHGDHHVVYQPGMEFGAAVLARRLVEAGLPDGELIVQEISVQPEYALRHTFTSIVSLSETPVREPAQPEPTRIKKAPTELVEGKSDQVEKPNIKWLDVLKKIHTKAFGRDDWSDLHHLTKAGLLRREFVIVNDIGQARVTAQGYGYLATHDEG